MMSQNPTPPHGMPAVTPAGPVPLSPGAVLELPPAVGGEVTVAERLGTRGLRRFFRATAADGHALTVVEDVTAPPPSPGSRIPDRRVLRPIHVATGPHGGTLRVFERPEAVTVTEWLADAAGPPDPLDVLRFGVNLCDVLECVHGAGFVLGSLDPEQVLRTPSLDVVLTGLEDLPGPGELPRQVTLSTAAPEVLHKMASLCGITSDVYGAAALLHALLARHELWTPPQGMSAVLAHQHSPRNWRPDLPLGIWPRLARALDPDPARRLPHVAALRRELLNALAAVQRRYAPRPPVQHVLDAWADSHVGVGKARRAGDQQDRLFCGLWQGATSALAAVADGVSHATVGDGGRAADHTVAAVRVLFDRVGAETRPGTGSAVTPPPERHPALAGVLVAATESVARDANENLGGPECDPAGMMASTLVLAWVEGGTASVLSVGDSRVYLYDGEVCEAVNIDHDRRSEAVRGGMDPYNAASLEAAGALTRAVGRVVLSPDGRLVASPSAPDIMDVPLVAGDRLLLCSDGLPDYAAPPARSVLSPVGIEEILAAHLRTAADLPDAAHQLIGLANRNGGHDNIAVVLVQVGAASGG